MNMTVCIDIGLFVNIEYRKSIIVCIYTYVYAYE
jgi:hypothetical protein